MRRVFRTELPVDDQWHYRAINGPIVHVATRHETAVELWFIDDTDAPVHDRAFRVVGTGQPIAPALAHYVGTAVTPSGQFVWHVFEHERPTT
jgi:hypothetical protein